MNNNDYNKYVAESKSLIVQVLDSFNIGRESDITVTTGPTVTLFEFKPKAGVRLSKIRNLKDEFTVALSASSVRVIAPIPERGTVGIEVPNKERQNVSMMEMLYSDEYMNTDMELPLVMGKTVNNEVFITDLAKMPHLLVAGATGQGKSVGLNVIITSLLNKRTPDELKLVLVDPKQVEFSVYEEISRPYLAHLAGHDAICTDAGSARETLNAVIRLMEARYTMLKEAGVRNLQEYNAVKSEKLPYYVVIIDEYGDLILSADDRGETEKIICRLAQKARAVGIHMIISTQRPDTKTVTGNIKANFPTRIAFRTTTGTDSRVILDRQGAERLSGKGDMLFFDDSPETQRVQCAYTSTEDVATMCRELNEEYADAQETLLPEPVRIAPAPKKGKLRQITILTAKGLAGWYYFNPMLGCHMTSRSELPLLQEMGIVSREKEPNGYKVLVNDIHEINRILAEYDS